MQNSLKSTYNHELWLPFIIVNWIIWTLLLAPLLLAITLNWFLYIWLYRHFVKVAGINKLLLFKSANVALATSTFAFLAGVHSHNQPEHQRKYLMPGKYNIQLNRKRYSVWYYPSWKKPIGNSLKMQNYTRDLPSVKFRSSDGKTINVPKPKAPQWTIYRCAGAIKIGEVNIPNRDKYQLDATSKDSSKWVIGLVPSKEEYSFRDRATGAPPFDYFCSETLSQ